MLDAFFASLAEAPECVLVADYDGTLAAFHEKRDQTLPYPGVPEALRDIMDAGGTRLVIVSGRPLDNLQARLAWLAPRPELWGSHGLERLTPAGVSTGPPVPAPLANLLDDISRWAAGRGWGDLFERKPCGFALHERPDPERYSQARHELLEHWNSALLRRTLEAHTFDGGIEFRLAGATKGKAVETLLGELPPGAAVAFLGDDLTDEDAFRALSGRGLRVLVRARRRPTEADLWLKPPDELIAFLSRWAKAVRSRGAADGASRRIP